MHEAATCQSVHRCTASAFFAILLAASTLARAQVATPAEPINPAAPIPSAPLPIIKKQKQGPCRVIHKSESSGKTLTAFGSSYLSAIAEFPPLPQTDLPAIPTDVKDLPLLRTRLGVGEPREQRGREGFLPRLRPLA